MPSATWPVKNQPSPPFLESKRLLDSKNLQQKLEKVAFITHLNPGIFAFVCTLGLLEALF